MNTVYSIFNLLGGITMFMYGMKIMGENLERAAGKNMKRMLSKVSNNPLSGVAIGTGVTAIIQSSSATTVMIVGFVNIGIMTLAQAAAVIMGANIGTTITLQITSLKSIINVTAIAGFLAAIGLFVNLLTKKNFIKKLGLIFVGLGMLFIGLEFMSMSVENFAQPLSKFFLMISNPILLVLFGMVFTTLIQSSSVATVIVASFAASGAIGMESALYSVLGMNIGTCVTALLSSIGTNVNAKRAAVLHLLFNVIGTLMFLILFYFIGFNNIRDFLTVISGDKVMRQIANFHTLFNVITTILLLPFINLLIKLVTVLVRKGAKSAEGFRLYYLDERVLKTPAVAVAQIKKEIINMMALAKKNIDLSIETLLTLNMENEVEIRKREEEIDYLNKAITAFLVKVSALDLSFKNEQIIGSYYKVLTDVERLGDYAENILNFAKDLYNDHIDFSQEAKGELKNFADILNNLHDNTLRVFIEGKITYLALVNKYEDDADNAKHEMVRAHISRLNKGSCTPESGSIYLSLATNFERIADHLTNIAESVLEYSKEK